MEFTAGAVIGFVLGWLVTIVCVIEYHKRGKS